MRDYEQMYSERLRSKIKEVIKGMVYVRVINDVLVIKIKCDEINFEHFYDDFANRFMDGFSCDFVVDDIYHKYEAFVINKTRKRLFY